MMAGSRYLQPGSICTYKAATSLLKSATSPLKSEVDCARSGLSHSHGPVGLSTPATLTETSYAVLFECSALSAPFGFL